MELDDLTLKDAFPTWFWTVGIVLAAGCAALLVLWYIEHPDRSPWTDFVRIPDDVSSLVDSSPGDGDPNRPG